MVDSKFDSRILAKRNIVLIVFIYIRFQVMSQPVNSKTVMKQVLRMSSNGNARIEKGRKTNTIFESKRWKSMQNVKLLSCITIRVR